MPGMPCLTAGNFTLPPRRLTLAPLIPGPIPQPAPRGRGETILLVEDDPGVRMVARRVLETFGYKVHEAIHGKAALGAWADQTAQIDLLLTDMVMPQGISGRELADRLRAGRPDL